MPSRNLGRAAAVALVIFVIDRASKIWVIDVLGLPEKRVAPLLDPWITLTMAWNEGINFGLFDFGASGRWVLIGLALAIVAALGVWVRRTQGWPAALGVGMIIGGALGNVWDRVQYGAVADFLNVTCCGIHNPFAFNIADACIFLGVAVLVLFMRDPASDHPRRPATKRDGRGGVR